MRYTIKNSNEIIFRADVKFNINPKKELDNFWEINELKELIVRDPMIYGFQYCHEGIPMIRISDLKQPFIDYSNVAFVSKAVHDKFYKNEAKKV